MVILPVLVWLGTAALLRGGRTVLDRLVLALALLLGATCAAGLVLSVWPWGLSPLPVAGSAVGGLVLLAVLLRRRPALPWRCPPGDRLILALTAVAVVSLLWPYRGLSRPYRLGMVGAGGDLASHFAIVDAIGRRGGYLFLRTADPAITSGLRTYPQGLHLTTALLLRFLPHTGGGGLPLAELDAFIWVAPASLALLCLSVLWALRRVATPATPALALLPIAALVTGYLVWSDPLLILWMGYWPELVGLAELAILAALLVRPLARHREQLVIVAALLVGLAYTYFLLLPVALVLVGAWLVWWRPPGRWTLPVLGAGLGLGAVMPVATLTTVGAGSRLLMAGSIPVPDERLLAVLGLLAVAGAVLGWRWRSVSGRLRVLLAVTALGLCALIGGYQLVGSGGVGYYFYKALHVAMLAFLLGLAPLARLLRPANGRPRWPVLVALGAAGLVVLGPFGYPSLGRSYLDRSLAWSSVGRTALAVAASVPAQPDTVTVIWSGRAAGYPAQTSQWANVLWRTNAVSWPGQMWVAYQPRTGSIPPAAILGLLHRTAPHRVRFVTDNPTLLTELRRIRAEQPGLRLDIVATPLPR